MGDRPTANEFTIRMQINRRGFEIAAKAIQAQVRTMWAQDVITENTMKTLLDTVTDMITTFTRAETDYYEMRNILESYDRGENNGVSC